jgi:hypothetical protein
VIAVVALLFSPLGVQPARADNVYASIRGVATDGTGAAISGAQLTATNTATGITITTVSQANGLYEFIQLPIGSYTVSAAKAGFKTFKSTAITLVVNQVYNLPIVFDIGATTETVEVNAEAVQVDTTTIQQTTLIGAQQIVDLPLNGRNFTALEQLAPGVQASNDRFGTFSVSGSQSNQSSYLINGADSNDIPLNTPLILPSPDAIQEFNLITSTINPEYGRNSGAIVNALIKSGSNQFHGDVFEFYRDTFLNSPNFFSKVVPQLHRNQFGGTLGGPVWKDKTFFFLSYQGTRTRQGFPRVVSVFSPAEVGGNFSADLATILRNGAQTTPFALVGDDGVSHPTGTAFFGTGVTGAILNCGNAITTLVKTCSNPNFGKLPTSDFNPLATSLTKQFVPLPNFTGNQFQFNEATTALQDQGIARIDHTFNSKNSVWATLTFNHAPSTDALPFTGSTLPGFGSLALAESKQFTVAYNHTFNADTLNEFRVSYTRLNLDTVEPQNPAQPSSFGFTGINSQNKAAASAPFISLTGFFNLGFSTNGPQPRKDQTYQLTDNFSKVVGRHTLKFGFNATRIQVDNPFSAVNNGSFSFGGSGHFTSGDPALDFLLGIPDSYSQSAGGVINARAYEYYSYAQDSWQVKNNLTLTLGTGYQIDTPYKNGQFGGEGFNCFQIGQQSKIFPSAPQDLTFPGDTGCNNAGTKTHYGHFGPRVGFAYTPKLGWLSGNSGNKLSIRGGYGIYYNRVEEEGALQNLGAPPFGVNSFGATDFGGNPSFANPYTDISTGKAFTNKFPFTAFPKPGDPTVDFGIFEPFVLNVINPNFNVPYSQNFNLNVQREFASNIVLSVSYIGALGRKLYRSYDANPITAAGQAACAADPTCRGGNRLFQHAFFPTHSVAPGDIFPGIGQQVTDGTSHYNSLQVGVTKGLTHGLLFSVSYTYSHSIDNGSGLENSGFGARGINLIDPSENVGDSAFDARHRLVTSFVYDIPSLNKITHWAPEKVFGGWRLSDINTWQGGFPLNFSDSGFNSLSCDLFSYYACDDNPSQVVPSVQKLNPRTSTFNGRLDYYFNPADFTRAARGTFGNTGRDSLHGPGFINTDFALLKDTKFTEHKLLELRIEAFNLFNHTNFNSPTTNILSQNFGRITSAGAGRIFQLGAKFQF